MLSTPRAALLTMLAVISGCAQTGTLSVETWGEEFIEQGLPAEVFADGWAIGFDAFLVSLAAVEISSVDSAAVSTLQTPAIFDLVQPGPVAVVDVGEVEAKRYDQVGATVAPAADAVAGSASAEDTARMTAGEHSVLVEGTATKGADSFTFAWTFQTATRYADCQGEDGAGLVVRGGEANTMQLTVHGDHLFYDDLAAEGAVLRADAIFAADANEDGAVTQAELSAVDLSTLPVDQYGNAGDAESLGDFITALSRTLIHFNGEGECSISAP